MSTVFWILVAVVVLLLVILRDGKEEKRLPYVDRYITEGNDGEPITLREKYLMDGSEAYRRKQAEVNNRRAMENNDGYGDHFPDP